MKRGDVYWVDLDPTKGSEIKKLRPCVILGADAINEFRRTVVVMPLSSSAKINPPLVVGVHFGGKKVGAVSDQIRAVDKSRFKKCAGPLSVKDMDALAEALKLVLEIY